MKSVGEVMGLGRTFEESFQKAIRQVDPKYVGFQGDEFEDLDTTLREPTDRRWLAVGQAMLHEGYSVGKVHEMTKIDRWFLHHITERNQGNRQPVWAARGASPAPQTAGVL
jgi:carbamoyl-phosphate synthase large subunit